MEKWKEKLENLRENCFEGEVTVLKTELWLLIMLFFLMGILYGLRKAPLTHGVRIGCNNGNSFGCAGHGKSHRERNGAGDEPEGSEAKESVEAAHGHECRCPRKRRHSQKVG